MCVNPSLTTYLNLSILSQGKKSYRQQTHVHNIFRHSVDGIVIIDEKNVNMNKNQSQSLETGILSPQ